MKTSSRFHRVVTVAFAAVFAVAASADRVKFLSYDELEKWYNCAIVKSSLATQL